MERGKKGASILAIAALCVSVVASCSGDGFVSPQDRSGDAAGVGDASHDPDQSEGSRDFGRDLETEAGDADGGSHLDFTVLYGSADARTLEGATLSGVHDIFLDVEAAQVGSVSYLLDGESLDAQTDPPFALTERGRPDPTISGLDTRRLDDGRHVLEVVIETVAGDSVRGAVRFDSDNGKGRPEQWREIGPEGGELAGFPDSNDELIVSPKDLWVEWPTFHSLGVQWQVEGDTNRNATVELSYREAGNSLWRPGLPLHRMMGERAAFVEANLDFTLGNMFAGSALFLRPETSYELRLRVVDPDAASDPVATVYLRQSTKLMARENPAGTARHVYPASADGSKMEPSYEDLQDALDEAAPGDRILLHEGSYSGQFRVRESGERGNPITIRPYQDDAVTLTNPRSRGGSSTQTFTIEADHILIENLHFEGASTAIRVDADEAVTGLTVRRCSFEDHGNTIWSRSVLAREITILGNTFQGGEDPDQNDWRGGFEDSKSMRSYKAVRLNGQGVDIGYNTFRLYRDAVSPDSSAGGTDDRRRRVSAWDAYRNDIAELGDDTEADFGSHNIRIFENFASDVFGPWSTQPIFGGPAYVIRNVQYNVTNGRAFKLHNQPVGVYVYNNTTFVSANVVARLMGGKSPVAASHVRNNAFWGAGGNTLYFRVNDPDISRLDHNAYSMREVPIVITYDELYDLDSERFYRGFEEIERELGMTLGRQFLEIDDFVNVTEPQGTAMRRSDLAGFDPRPLETSALIDAALPIPNVTDGWSGSGPDIGAYESDAELRECGADAL